MNSCREASAFFKKRAALEEEYGRSLLKLSKASLESYGSIDGKAGSYVSSYHTILSTHEHLAESRLRFAQRLGEMSEELNTLVGSTASCRAMSSTHPPRSPLLADQGSRP